MAVSYTRRLQENVRAIRNTTGATIPIGGGNIPAQTTVFYVDTRWYDAIKNDAGVADALASGDLTSRTMNAFFSSNECIGNSNAGRFIDRQLDDCVAIKNTSGSAINIDNVNIPSGANQFWIRTRWVKAIRNDPLASTSLQNGDLLLRSSSAFFNSRDCRGNSRAGAL